jgi:hypothetical protein
MDGGPLGRAEVNREVKKKMCFIRYKGTLFDSRIKVAIPTNSRITVGDPTMGSSAKTRG